VVVSVMVRGEKVGAGKAGYGGAQRGLNMRKRLSGVTVK
jgi:hypothetical protein